MSFTSRPFRRFPVQCSVTYKGVRSSTYLWPPFWALGHQQYQPVIVPGVFSHPPLRSASLGSYGPPALPLCLSHRATQIT